MIPSGIVFGSGLLLAYSAATGRWQDWNFLWMFELLVLLVSIFVPIRINQIEGAPLAWSKAFGLILTLVCVALSMVVILLALLLA